MTLLKHVFYDAALDDTSWPAALQQASDHLGDARMMICDGVPGEPASFFTVTHRFDESVWAHTGYRPSDFYDLSLDPFLVDLMALPAGQSRELQGFVSASRMAENELIRKTIIPADFFDLRLALLDADFERVPCVAVRPLRVHPSDKALAREVDALLPHLERALRFRRRLAQRRSESERLAVLLSHNGRAVVVVNLELRMLWRNDAAAGLFEQNDGLSVRTGVIALADQSADKTLRHAVSGAMDGTGPLRMRQSRSSGSVPLMIEVFSAVGMSHLPGCSDAMATIIITDPMSAIELQDSQSLSAQFDLTPAEARVARLLPLSLNRREIAERLGLSENTVKTHLAATREKLGARSMTELALIVARVRGALASDA